MKLYEGEETIIATYAPSLFSLDSKHWVTCREHLENRVRSRKLSSVNNLYFTCHNTYVVARFIRKLETILLRRNHRRHEKSKFYKVLIQFLYL